MKAKLFIFFISLSFISGCNLNSEDIDREINLTDKAAKLVEADNEFGLELFQKVVAYEKEAGNIMVSPLSVSLALAMAYNGANGETKTAMERALKLYGLSDDDINESYKTLVEALKSLDKKVLLEIANAIYYRDDFTVEPAFISVNQNYYDAAVSPLDFSDPGSVDVINGWVADKTRDKITRILDEISADQVMFLLNAVYFKGVWQKEFNSKSTVEYPFHLENGEVKDVGMMCRLDTLDYLSNSLFKAIRLAYGKGNYNMYVFLPEEGKTVNNIIEQLNKANWGAWMDGFRQTNSVDIKLPKFKFKYEIKLNDVLSDMGMGVAFSGAADFTGISKSGELSIDYVKHKTFVEVNEEGTEAAAVTVVAIELTSVGNEPQKIPFIVNKPFLFAITEKDTGAILFMGKVVLPEYSG
ncbi:Serine protease inhibitor (serpin family) [hydrothermal vent metagenome]|uniref:Serine protease inhibitor (Serpin family) n=1 Tax=hydrothermal vent metagenome TaxID=652676 RepID=A0A3B0TQD9_9ZZZZ